MEINKIICYSDFLAEGKPVLFTEVLESAEQRHQVKLPVCNFKGEILDLMNASVPNTAGRILIKQNG